MKKILAKKEIVDLRKNINTMDDNKFRQIGLNMITKLGNALDNAIEDKNLSTKGLIKGLLEEIDCLKAMINSPEYTSDEKKQFVLRISDVNDIMAKNNIGQTVAAGAILTAVVLFFTAVIKNISKREK